MAPAYVGRLAPSPTGAIHQGTARSCLAAWLDCRAHGGRLVLRIEDVDRPRCVPGAEAALIRDLSWLGLDWDEGPGAGSSKGPFRQSERTSGYRAALEALAARGRTFPCTCSRREVGARYPGTCRHGPRPDRPHPGAGRVAAVRFRTEADDRVCIRDRLFGVVEQDVHAEVGDFVLRRADGLTAYQLAVTVDDLAQGVTHVVRGSDLLDSAPRQALLRNCLAPDAPALEWLHVPLIVATHGKKLSKRDGAVPLANLRDRGLGPREVVGALASSLGLVPPGTAIGPDALVPLWRVDRLPAEDQVADSVGL